MNTFQGTYVFDAIEPILAWTEGCQGFDISWPTAIKLELLATRITWISKEIQTNVLAMLITGISRIIKILYVYCYIYIYTYCYIYIYTYCSIYMLLYIYIYIFIQHIVEKSGSLFWNFGWFHPTPQDLMMPGLSGDADADVSGQGRWLFHRMIIQNKPLKGM